MDDEEGASSSRNGDVKSGDGSPTVFMDRKEFEELESFHEMVLNSDGGDEDEEEEDVDLRMPVLELNEEKGNLEKAMLRIAELEEAVEARESIARDAESRRQAAVAAEKRAEEISTQLSDRLAAKDAELYSLRKETEEKVIKLTQQFNAATKDKEAMVMRYAQSEKEVIIAKRDRENLERKLSDMGKDKDSLMIKLKNMANDKAKLAQNLDTKTSEVFQLLKEVDRLKEEIVSRDVKIKWGQNKLKSEMDAHQETKAQLDKSARQLQDLREEANQVRVDCQNLLRSYQEESSTKAATSTPEGQEDLKQLEELHVLKDKHASAVDENLSLSQKIQRLETERLDHEHSVAQLKDTINQLRKEAVQSRKNAQELEHAKAELAREKESRAAAEAEIAEVKANNEDLVLDMASCRQKEAELLEFSATLTEKNVGLQSELRCVEARVTHAEAELASWKRRLTDAEERSASVEEKMSHLQLELSEERRISADASVLFSSEKERLEDRVVELEDQVKVLQKKNAAGIKALTKELECCNKKLEETSRRKEPPVSPASSAASPSASKGRLSAKESSKSTDSPEKRQKRVAVANGQMMGDGHYQQESSAVLAPSQEMLVEKIVKLQQILARRKEKMEVLEEHRRHLVRELRKKTAIIQHYVLKDGDNHQAIVPEDRDRHKAAKMRSQVSKMKEAQMARYGGIMASVYSSRASDGTMTLDLSLEINRKLQAILEDTLLKNITLKENLNTLGDEIARLTQHHQKKQRVLETKIKDLEERSNGAASMTSISVEDDT